MYKLFVGGLPFSTTDDELADAFSQFGTVASAKVITDRETGRSKGFGFVEFENDDEGKAAEAGMNGKELGGRTVTVNEARPREERPRRDFNGGGNGGGRQNSW
jgi:RNA recognition motif-containing protein